MTTSMKFAIFNAHLNPKANERYHKAARDGNLLILKEANKRELNSIDEDGMTAAHWAAYDGRLEALRIITGRGANPDLTDAQGQTSLHHAVRRNHLHCVSFLINFGCNIWALDDDGHSALDLAGILGHDRVVRYLDAELARRYMEDRRTAEKSKLRAIQDVERRLHKKEHELEKRLADLDLFGHQQQQQQTSQQHYRHQKILQTLKHGQENSNSRNGGKPGSDGNYLKNRVDKEQSTAKSMKEKFMETLRSTKKTKKEQGGGGGGKSGKCATAPTTTTAASAAAAINRRRCLSMAELSKVSSKDVLFGNPVSAVVGNSRDSEENSSNEKVMAKKPLGLFERPGFGSVSFRNLRVVAMFAGQSIDVEDDKDFENPLESISPTNAKPNDKPLFTLSLANSDEVRFDV